MSGNIHITNPLMGMGDQIFQLPHIRKLCKQYDAVYIFTPWPQIYWDMPKVHCLHPSLSDNPVKNWMYIQRNISSQPEGTWSCPDPAFIASMDKLSWDITYYSSKSTISVMSPLLDKDSKLDIGLQLKSEWLIAANIWLNRLVPAHPRILIYPPHIGLNGEVNSRFCPFTYFKYVYQQYCHAGNFFGITCSADPGLMPMGVIPDIPYFTSSATDVTTFWSLLKLVDILICTNNHAIAFAMAFGTKTLYLGGRAVPRDNLFDTRIESDRLKIIISDDAGKLDKDEINKMMDELLAVSD